MKPRLLLINAALILFLGGLAAVMGGNLQTGAILVLSGAATLLGNYTLLGISLFRQSNIRTWPMLAFGAALLGTGVIFMHGFSSAMGMMMAFRVKSFTALYLISGFLLPTLLFFISYKTAPKEDRKWVAVGVAIGAALCLTGLLGFSRLFPFPTQTILYSWVGLLFFYLIFLAKKYVSGREKKDKQESLMLLVLSCLFVGFWVFRFVVRSPMEEGFPKALIELGFVPLFLLPLAILSVRKYYPYLVFLFYFALLDFYFIQYDPTFNYLVTVGLNDCEGYDQATDYPVNTDPGVPLAELLRAPTEKEIEAIRLEWQEKDFSPKNIQLVYAEVLPNGDSLKVLSHLVNGLTHYGAIRIPRNLDIATAPILLELEGGGTGVDVSTLRPFTQGICSEQTDRFLSILPSFRGCIVRGNDFCFRSEGYAGDPWLGPAEDAVAFLEAVKSFYHKPDDTPILAKGLSRGATVALIIGGLTDKLDYLIATSTHTHFLDEYVVQHERVGTSYARAFYTPAAPPEQIRKRILASSPYFFAANLTPFEIHQATTDEQTTIWHAHMLKDRLQELGREPDTYKFFIYEGEGHAYQDDEVVCKSLANFLP